MKTWQCTVCKYIHKGSSPPDKCPVCGVPASKFIEIDPADIPEKKSRATGKPPGKTPEKQTAPASGMDRVTDLMVRHHAHPVSVHFPNGVLPVAFLVFLVSWILDMPFFTKVGVVNLVFVALAMPFVLFSGTIEWKKKYRSAMTVMFKLKIAAAAVTTISCLILLVWYIADPEVLLTARGWLFILISLVMVASAGVAGYIGGKLVFKD